MDLSDGATSTGVFSAKLDDVSVIQPLLEKPIEALTALSSVSALGDVAWTGKQFSLTNIESTVSGPDLAANFNGDANYNEGVSLSGSFDAETRDLPAVIETAGLLLPDAAALKRLTAKGQLIFADDKVTVSDLTASASEGFLNGQYEGEFGYDEKMNLAGQFNGEISDLGALDAALPRDIPYSDVAKRITLSSQISGLSAALEDGLLNGDFKGQLSLGDKSDVSGLLTMSADSLREIAMTQDVDVPPSTPVGRIFEAFQLSGEVSGTAEVINFNNGALGLDNISTSGDFVLNMTGTKPLLTGQLDMNALDLRPYMAAWSEQKPDGVILPWSTTPINLGGLEAVDAEINFYAPEIIMDRLKLGATEGRVDLKNALLSTDLSKSQLYGGLVNGSLSLSGASGIPRVSIQADIDSVAAQNFLSAASGFDKVAGTATLSLSLDGQGISQDAIMRSLNGKGSFKILNGQLLGINADELMSGLDTALTNRTIPQGLGLGKVTNFKDLIGNFSITNGRANLGNFELQSGAVFIDAAGMVDIGAQRLNIGIRPKLSEGSDLAQFGIPLKFSGAFGEAKAGLDTDVLADIAKAKAREKAGGLIQDRVGGTVGGILGGIIGGNQNAPAQETSETQPPERPEKQTPPDPIGDATEQSSPENAPVTEGVSPEPAAPDPATSPETESSEPSVPVDLPKPEEAIENALKDLFGRKKKENTGE
jgi:AsmA protein